MSDEPKPENTQEDDQEQRLAALEERVRALEEQTLPREPDEDVGLP
jgi:hypothetical protein